MVLARHIGVAYPQWGSRWKDQFVINKIEYWQTDDDNGS